MVRRMLTPLASPDTAESSINKHRRRVTKDTAQKLSRRMILRVASVAMSNQEGVWQQSIVALDAWPPSMSEGYLLMIARPLGALMHQEAALEVYVLFFLSPLTILSLLPYESAGI